MMREEFEAWAFDRGLCADDWPSHWRAWKEGARLAPEREDIGALMEKYNISVWVDPYWWPEATGTDKWLAGANARVVEGTYCSTLTGSDPADIQADHTAHGSTPAEAVRRCAEAIRALLGTDQAGANQPVDPVGGAK